MSIKGISEHSLACVWFTVAVPGISYARNLTFWTFIAHLARAGCSVTEAPSLSFFFFLLHHMGSTPQAWKRGVLTTELWGKSLASVFKKCCLWFGENICGPPHSYKVDCDKEVLEPLIKLTGTPQELDCPCPFSPAQQDDYSAAAYNTTAAPN